MDPLNILAKFEVRSFTRSSDNRGYLKISEVPGYANTPFSLKFLKGFCWDKHCEYTCKFEVRSSMRS